MKRYKPNNTISPLFKQTEIGATKVIWRKRIAKYPRQWGRRRTHINEIVVEDDKVYGQIKKSGITVEEMTNLLAVLKAAGIETSNIKISLSGNVSKKLSTEQKSALDKYDAAAAEKVRLARQKQAQLAAKRKSQEAKRKAAEKKAKELEKERTKAAAAERAKEATRKKKLNHILDNLDDKAAVKALREAGIGK